MAPLSPSVSVSNSIPPIPSQALQYRRTLVANVQFVWGLSGPIATMAGQIHAESSWNPSAKSPYASGLAQVTPGTALDLATEFPDLSANAPLEPQWAIRALARYDYKLYNLYTQSASPCDQWAFTLSAYNGGAGNVQKDKNLTAAHHADSQKWWGNVANYSLRSSSAFIENRAYPDKILHHLQFIYASWGPTITCS